MASKDSEYIDIDFRRDLVACLRLELENLGYDFGSVTDDRQTLIACLSAFRQMVLVQPRQVLKARDFTCPSEHYQGLTNIERIIQMGGDLTPYLSKGIKRLDRPDRMLDHWGIYHLHLGDHTSGEFAERTGLLLYCRFDEKYAYLICIAEHNRWSSQSMLKTVHENWPESIEHSRLYGILELEFAVTDDDVNTVRQGNVNPLIDVAEGVVCFAPGGGVLMNGDNLRDAMVADRMLRWASDLQQEIIDDFDKIKSEATENGFAFATPAMFKLSRWEGYWCLVEETSDLCLILASSP